MTIKSLDQDWLKRQTTDTKIGVISSYSSIADFNRQVFALATHNKMATNDLNLRPDANIDGDPILVIYVTRPETDEEYAKRLRRQEFDDLRSLCDTLTNLNTCAAAHEHLKGLIAKHPHVVPDWQKKQVDAFFDAKTWFQQVKEARKEGEKEGYKKAKVEFESKIKKAVAQALSSALNEVKNPTDETPNKTT